LPVWRTNGTLDETPHAINLSAMVGERQVSDSASVSATSDQYSGRSAKQLPWAVSCVGQSKEQGEFLVPTTEQAMELEERSMVQEYSRVAALMDPLAMADFIRDIIMRKGGCVLQEIELMNVAIWHCEGEGVASFQALLDELRAADWIERPSSGARCRTSSDWYCSNHASPAEKRTARERANSDASLSFWYLDGQPLPDGRTRNTEDFIWSPFEESP